MTGQSGARSSQLNLTRWWLALCGLVALALIAAARIKGGYIDEYWTISFADSTVPLRHAFEAWSMETGHAVGFYALSRAGDYVLPPDLFVRRLSNLAYFVLAIAIAWWSGKEQRRFGLLYLAGVAASPYVVERFAEYRAIFLGLMLIAMLVIRIRAAVTEGKTGTASAMLIAALMAALALADYPLAISGLALCGAWGLFAAVDRDWRSAVVAGAGIATAMITVAASLANAARYPIYPSPYFQPFAGLVRDLAVVNGTALLPCVAMLGLALVQIRRERLPLRGASAGTPWLRILILATVLTAAALIVVNAATHSLIRRQIFGIVPLVVAWLVELSLPHLKRRPLTVVLIGVNLLAVAAGTALALQWKPYFDRFGPRMAQAQQSCPTLPIYAVLPENIVGTRDNRFPMPDQVAIGYRDVTDRYDLRVRTAVPRDWVDPRCGAIIWSEYLWLNAPPTPQLIAGKLGLDPRSLRGVTIEYVDQSMLMRVPPPATP